MIRIDSIWLATEPMDMRAGTDTALAKVIAVFGAAQPHCAYLFANRRANRIKVLVHDGFGIWLATRRLADPRVMLPDEPDSHAWQDYIQECMRVCNGHLKIDAAVLAEELLGPRLELSVW